jgi:hypothetical protein
MRVSLKSLLAAGLAIGAIGSVASAATVGVSSTVSQSGFFGPQSGGPYQLTDLTTPYDFTGQVNSFANVTSVDSITVTLTSIFDGDTAIGNFDFDSLTLGLDGIDTGLKLNGLPDGGILTLSFTGIPSLVQAQLIAALADGKLIGTIIDADADGPAGDFLGIPALDTTLELTLSGANLVAGNGGTGGNGGGPNAVPLPAAVLIAPLGACVAGIYSRRFRKAK